MREDTATFRPELRERLAFDLCNVLLQCASSRVFSVAAERVEYATTKLTGVLLGFNNNDNKNDNNSFSMP